MSIKKLTRRIWYGSGTTVDGNGNIIASVPPIAVNDGSEDWYLNGIVRGELYLNDNANDPALFCLGSDGQVKRIGGGFGGGTSFWELINVDSSKNPLNKTNEYILTKYTAASTGDVVAFASSEKPDSDLLPVGSYDSLGILRVKKGGGIMIDNDGYIYVDPSFEGGNKGIDESQLQQYLTTHHYLTPNGKLYGYIPMTDNPMITADDTVNGAFNKVENKLQWIQDNYVTIATDQTVTGQKTFTKTIIGKADVIAYYSDDSGDVGSSGLPVAGYGSLGIVGIMQGGGIVVGDDGMISIDPSFSGGGNGISDLVSTGTGNAVTSISYDPDTKIITYTKGSNFALASQIPTALKNPYSLTWSGYSSGSYDGSSSGNISIPSDTSQLSNGAGYITGISASTSGDGPFVTSVSGNGTSMTATKAVTITNNSVVRINTSGTGAFTYWRTDNSTGIKIGGGNQITGYSGSYGTLGNLYFNWQNSGQWSRVDDENNFATTGDVVAFATSAVSATIPVASATSYGIVKYDNSTLKVNSSGQLYVASGGSGSSTSYWDDISGKPSGLVTGVSISGSGNAVTNASFSNGTLTLTKGTISASGGSNTFTLESASFSSDIVWSCSSTSYGICIRRSGSYTQTRISGNIINGMTGSGYALGNLYLNYNSNSVNVRVDNAGKIYSNGTQVSSDLRLKKVVGCEENVLDRMMKIPVIKYFRNDIINSSESTGFGAQSFISVFDNVTYLNDDSGYYGISEGAILAIAWQGVKELYTEHLLLRNLISSRGHWELTKDQQIRNLQDTVIRLQSEINELKKAS